MLPPTPKQLIIEDFIGQFIAEHRYSPTIKELAEHFGKSDPTMKAILDRMEARGRIKRVRGIARTIELAR